MRFVQCFKMCITSALQLFSQKTPAHQVPLLEDDGIYLAERWVAYGCKNINIEFNYSNIIKFYYLS